VPAAVEIQLVKRPHKSAEPEDFEAVEVPLRRPRSGEITVANKYISVDPYMRLRMDEQSAHGRWPLRAPLDGDAVGVVVESRASDFREGDWVVSEGGWRSAFVSRGETVQGLQPPPSGYTYSVYLGALGPTGQTAYLGVVDILDAGPGQAIWISAAAGAVGSVAGQIGRLRGAATIGSTSTADKASLLTRRFGFDSAFVYGTDEPLDAVRKWAPQGINGFFDNVGGSQLQAALELLCVGGRIAKCGSIASYDRDRRVPGLTNLDLFHAKRLTMRGFLVSDHKQSRGRFQDLMRGWLESRSIVAVETVVHGFDNIVSAFLGLFDGQNIGKVVVEIG
jgi:NADPH-dependent curcumin reductase CurA